MTEPKVVATDDEYNMPLFVWEEMSAGIAASAPNIPLLFGPMLRNFLEYLHQMTASEWQLFTFLLAPVYLKDALPDDDYDEFISLVEARWTAEQGEERVYNKEAYRLILNTV